MTKTQREVELIILRRSKRGLLEIVRLYEEYTGVGMIDKSVITYQQMCDVILEEEVSQGIFEQA